MAELPDWPQDLLGWRLLASCTFLAQARNAPCLLTADVPDAAEIIADPAHWNVATTALVRAVAFDGPEIGHPESPILDGPASLLGGAVLAEVTKALISDHPAAEELAVLSRALDGTIPGVAGSVVASAMIDAARLPDLRELPTEVLSCSPPTDNPLEILVTAGEIAPGDVPRAGLSILAALIRLGESELAYPSRHAA